MKRFERSNGLDTALYKNYLFCLRALLQSKGPAKPNDIVNDIVDDIVTYGIAFRAAPLN